MPTDFIPAGHVPPGARDRVATPGHTPLAMMRQLEASLHGSHKALLSLDLGGIERGTSEQFGLLREFDALLRQGMTAAMDAPEAERERVGYGNRILEAVRLQRALLARSQCKLRVLANMLAGPSVIYGPLGARNSGPSQVFLKS